MNTELASPYTLRKTLHIVISYGQRWVCFLALFVCLHLMGAVCVSAQPGQPQDTMPEWGTSFYLKTNFLTYPLNLTANLAAEVEIGRHFSLSVPFYYSAMNWFRENIKFRVSGTQPEFRYWFRRDFKGFFAGAHITFGWYNIAVGGRYRYQDHATTSPVLGYGFTGGWRMPLAGSRWSLEFTLGVGYLPFYYDTFYNLSNGSLAEEGLRKNYWGPDNAAVTLCYRFGKRRAYE